MALRHLGERIDIHGGGSDLIYPHHENEIAQTESATGKRPFAGWWMHPAPVRLGGEKMSKSLGNMVFVRDALRTTTPEALRLYLLDAPYRRPFDHDEDRLERARWRAAAIADALGRGRSGPIGRDEATRAIIAALEDDLDTPRAIRLLERASRRSSSGTRSSLRAIARGIMGVL
jgi:L-cysteine:1D-myo-inositol 2-amino-2-deoxy-alpha-D-glucopyranoside ligase